MRSVVWARAVALKESSIAAAAIAKRQNFITRPCSLSSHRRWWADYINTALARSFLRKAEGRHQLFQRRREAAVGRHDAFRRRQFRRAVAGNRMVDFINREAGCMSRASLEVRNLGAAAFDRIGAAGMEAA